MRCIAISARDKNSINKTFDTKAIDSITKRKIKTDLNPVIKTKDDFELVYFDAMTPLARTYSSSFTENEIHSHGS